MFFVIDKNNKLLKVTKNNEKSPFSGIIDK